MEQRLGRPISRPLARSWIVAAVPAAAGSAVRPSVAVQAGPLTLVPEQRHGTRASAERQSFAEPRLCGLSVSYSPNKRGTVNVPETVVAKGNQLRSQTGPVGRGRQRERPPAYPLGPHALDPHGGRCSACGRPRSRWEGRRRILSTGAAVLLDAAKAKGCRTQTGVEMFNAQVDFISEFLLGK